VGGVARPDSGGVVVIVAVDQVQLLHVAGPLEVLTAANRSGPRYDVRVVSPNSHDVVTSCGLRIRVDASLEELPENAHTLVVPGPRPQGLADRHLSTSAGVTAGIHMALALVEEDHGAGVVAEM
jgi:transcriptional regulator GlxA family with amidase domain